MDKKFNRGVIISEINKLLERIKGEYKISQVYLFGSYAKSNFTDDSDIDIAIIIDDNIDEFDVQMKLMRISSRINPRLEPHPVQAVDFNIKNPFSREIIETGIKVV